MTEKNIPIPARPYYERIVALTDAVCSQHLNDEYAGLCRSLAAALARKRPSPLARGKPELWAAGVLHAIGYVNFLFDSSQTPHLGSDALSALFNVPQGSTASKSKQIRNLFHMRRFDPDWSLPSRLKDNPLVWMLSIDGFPIDIRHAPRELQVIAYEKGLIPYIPADQAA